MTGHIVYNLHQSYKIGEKAVIQYLYDEASKHTDVDALLQGTSSHRDDPASIKVTTDDLPRLANVIRAPPTSDKLALRRLADAITIGNSIIAKRRECEQWHTTSNGLTTTAAADTGHRHRITVWRAAIATLEQLYKMSQPAASSSPSPRRLRTDKEPIQDLANSFAALELQEADYSESVEALCEEQSPRKTGNISQQEVKPRRVVPEVDDDAGFALWCTFKQCHALRLRLKDLRKQWRMKEVSILVAAEETNAAFALIHAACRSLVAEYPRFSTYHPVLKQYNIRCERRDGVVTAFECDESSTEGQEASAVSYAEILNIDAFYELSLLAKCYAETLAKNWSAARTLLSQILAGHRLTRTLLMGLSHLQGLVSNPTSDSPLHGCDIFTSDFAKFFQDGKLTLHWVVEYQMYMDICDVVEDAGLQPLKIAEEYVIGITSSYRDFQESCTAFTNEPELHNVALPTTLTDDGLLRCLERARRQLSAFDMNTALESAATDTSKILIPLAVFPTLTGCCLSRLVQAKFVAAVALCDQKKAFLACAHVYRAARVCQLVDERWDDMEFAIENLRLGFRDTSEDAIGKANIREYADHFVYLFGARARRNKGNQSASLTRRPFPSIDATTERRRRMKLAHGLLEQINQDAKKHGNKGPRTALEVSDSLSSYALRASSTPKTGTRQARRSHKFTPETLLDTYSNGLREIEKVLNFDLHSLFTKSMDIMMGLKQYSLDHLTEPWPNNSFFLPKKNTSLVMVANELLWRAVDQQTHEKKTGSENAVLLKWMAGIIAALGEQGLPAQYSEAAAQQASDSLAAAFRPALVGSHTMGALPYCQRSRVWTASASIRGINMELVNAPKKVSR